MLTFKNSEVGWDFVFAMWSMIGNRHLNLIPVSLRQFLWHPFPWKMTYIFSRFICTMIVKWSLSKVSDHFVLARIELIYYYFQPKIKVRQKKFSNEVKSPTSTWAHKREMNDFFHEILGGSCQRWETYFVRPMFINPYFLELVSTDSGENFQKALFYHRLCGKEMLQMLKGLFCHTFFM